MRLKKLVIIPLLLCVIVGVAQSKKTYRKTYSKACDLYRSGQYTTAFEAFKEIANFDPNNEFSEYGHYYCGLSAYQLQKWADARFVLVRLLKERPSWKKIDEARYLMAAVAFEEQDYAKAFTYIGEINNEELRSLSEKMSSNFVHSIVDINELKDLQAQYPFSNQLAKALYIKLNQHSIDKTIADNFLTSYLYQEYEFESDTNDLQQEGQEIDQKRDAHYEIAVLLPFNFHTGQSSALQLALIDFVAGLEIAIDSLTTDSLTFSYQLYDTRKDTTVLKQLLQLPSIVKSDLLIGPYSFEESKLVSKFAQKNNIAHINPFSQFDKLLDYDFTYLFKPSHSVKGREIAEYAIDSIPGEDVLIFYGSELKDSILAASYRKTIDESVTKNVKMFRRINASNISDIGTTIQEANSTNRLSHIFVAGKSHLLGSYVVTGLETEDVNTTVIAPKEWLKVQTIGFEQLKRRNVLFYIDGYIDLEDSLAVQPFRESFKAKMGVKPIREYAHYGFDITLFFGNLLASHGTLFKMSLEQEQARKGYTLAGYNFLRSNANQIVSLYRFTDDYKIEWVNETHSFSQKKK